MSTMEGRQRSVSFVELPFVRSLTLMASMVPARSVAMGFSQKTCLPALAHFLIWSAWNCEGEQIHTACTSGWLITCKQ